MRRAAAALLALLAWPAAAERPLLPGIGPQDPRRLVPMDELPWRAVGRVQTELGGRCTGAMIGPRKMLTAAHCLVAPQSRELVQPGSVHVLLAYDRGQSEGHAQVTEYRLGAGYLSDGSGPAESDWAVLTLDRALGTPDRVLPLAAARRGMAVALAGYQQDRPEVLLADADCRVLAVNGSLIIHNCAGTRGSSGAPLLGEDATGRWAIIGVASRVQSDGQRGLAVAVDGIPRR